MIPLLYGRAVRPGSKQLTWADRRRRAAQFFKGEVMKRIVAAAQHAKA
jgi:hypothetical protein